jgi:hypothetical protein
VGCGFISAHKISDNGLLFSLCLHARTFKVVCAQGCGVPHAQCTAGRRVGDIRPSSVVSTQMCVVFVAVATLKEVVEWIRHKHTLAILGANKTAVRKCRYVELNYSTL